MTRLRTGKAKFKSGPKRSQKALDRIKKFNDRRRTKRERNIRIYKERKASGFVSELRSGSVSRSFSRNKSAKNANIPIKEIMKTPAKIPEKEATHAYIGGRKVGIIRNKITRKAKRYINRRTGKTVLETVNLRRPSGKIPAGKYTVFHDYDNKRVHWTGQRQSNPIMSTVNQREKLAAAIASKTNTRALVKRVMRGDLLAKRALLYKGYNLGRNDHVVGFRNGSILVSDTPYRERFLDLDLRSSKNPRSTQPIPIPRSIGNAQANNSINKNQSIIINKEDEHLNNYLQQFRPDGTHSTYFDPKTGTKRDIDDLTIERIKSSWGNKELDKWMKAMDDSAEKMIKQQGLENPGRNLMKRFKKGSINSATSFLGSLPQVARIPSVIEMGLKTNRKTEAVKGSGKQMYRGFVGMGKEIRNDPLKIIEHSVDLAIGAKGVASVSRSLNSAIKNTGKTLSGPKPVKKPKISESGGLSKIAVQVINKEKATGIGNTKFIHRINGKDYKVDIRSKFNTKMNPRIKQYYKNEKPTTTVGLHEITIITPKGKLISGLSTTISLKKTLLKQMKLASREEIGSVSGMGVARFRHGRKVIEKDFVDRSVSKIISDLNYGSKLAVENIGKKIIHVSGQKTAMVKSRTISAKAKPQGKYAIPDPLRMIRNEFRGRSASKAQTMASIYNIPSLNQIMKTATRNMNMKTVPKTRQIHSAVAKTQASQQANAVKSIAKEIINEFSIAPKRQLARTRPRIRTRSNYKTGSAVSSIGTILKKATALSLYGTINPRATLGTTNQRPKIKTVQKTNYALKMLLGYSQKTKQRQNTRVATRLRTKNPARPSFLIPRITVPRITIPRIPVIPLLNKNVGGAGGRKDPLVTITKSIKRQFARFEDLI